MAYEGAKEFVSAQTASYPGLVGLEMGQSSFNWAVTSGTRARELKKLSTLNQSAGNQVRVLVDALERVGYSPDLFVSKQGSVSMRLSGKVINIPVFDQLRGTVTMGASQYAGAMQQIQVGSSMERMNVMDAFIHRVRAHIPGEGVRIKGIDAIQDKGAMPGVLADLAREAREEWLQSIHSVTGDLQYSKAYYLKSRLQLDVTNIPALQNRAEELATLQRHFATKQNMQLGGGKVLKYGSEMEQLIAETESAFRQQLHESVPDGRLTGLKPGAFMVHLRQTKSGKSTSRKVILSLLPGDAISGMEDYGNLEKGRYQEVLSRLMHRDDLPTDAISTSARLDARNRMGKRRIVPIVTEKGYFNQLKQVGAMRAHRLGRKFRMTDLQDLTTKAPMTIGLMDPGQSTAAYRWLRQHVDDTGVLLGTRYARAVAGAGERNYQVKVNVNRFTASRDLPAFIRNLEYQEHKQLNILAQDFGAVLQDNTIITPNRGRGAQVYDQYVLGVSTDPFGEQRHMMDVDDMLESVQRKGDELIFKLRRGKPSAGLGAGLKILDRRVGVTGSMASLGSMGIDVAGGIGEFGLKFGKDAAFTHSMYAGHVFSRLERSGIRQARYEGLMERVANAMGAEVTWHGDARMGRRTFQSWLKSDAVTESTSKSWMKLAQAASSGSPNRLRRHEVVKAALSDKYLTQAEKIKIYSAFEIRASQMSEVMGVTDPNDARRMAEAGARMLHLEGAPVSARDIDMPNKFATNWRLTEHNLWRARGAGLMQQDAQLGKAFKVLDDFLAPRISESGVASDTLRFLGQFSSGMEEIETHLMAATTYTPDDIAKLATIPEAKEGKLMAQQLVGQETLISTMGSDPANQRLAYRRGGFNVTLREGDSVAIGIGSSRGGKIRAKTTSRFFIPGMEMFGKYGNQPELFMEGGSRVVDNVVERRLFGDYMNVLKSLDEYSRGSGSVTALQERLNILYHGMGEKLLGKESLLKRYFTPDAARGLTGRTITHPGLHGAGDELTIGIAEEALSGLDPKMRARFKQGNAFAMITHYPTSDVAHQSIVKVKVMKRAELLTGLTKKEIAEYSMHDAHKVIASSPALRLMSQRDLDFDWSYLRFIDDKEALKAAQALHASDLKRFGPVFELLNTLPAKAEEEFGLAFKKFEWEYMGQAIDDKTGRKIPGEFTQMTGRKAMMEELSAIVRQQAKTPVAYNSFVKQRQIASWIGFGRQRDMVLEAVGGAKTRAGKSVLEAASLLGDPRHRHMMGEVWTATINSMLKKGAKEGSYISELTTTMASNAKQAITSTAHRDDLAETFYNLFVENKATQGILADMGLTGTVGPGAKDLAMERYFNPLAEFMGHMQVVEDAVTGTHLKHALVALTGTVGEYSRLEDLEGIMGQLAQLQGVTSPRLSEAMQADADAIRHVLKDTDHLNVREAIAAVGDEPAAEAIARQAKNTAMDGLEMMKALWKKPWGKIGMIAGGAAVAAEMFGGLFSGDPEPVYPGGGAPMPPQPAMAGMAQRQHLNQGTMPPAQARIQMPYHMRTHAMATMYAPARPMVMPGGGYVSPLPSDSNVVYAEGYQPDATRWGMQNFLTRRMSSSY